MTEAELTREAYRRVFNPFPDDMPATEADRGRVLRDLAGFCNYETEFSVTMGAADLGFQLAVQEGRRAVFLRIKKASEQSRKARPTISREGITE